VVPFFFDPKTEIISFKEEIIEGIEYE